MSFLLSFGVILGFSLTAHQGANTLGSRWMRHEYLFETPARLGAKRVTDVHVGHGFACVLHLAAVSMTVALYFSEGISQAFWVASKERAAGICQELSLS